MKIAFSKMRTYKPASHCPICNTPNPWIKTDVELARKCKVCSSTTKIEFKPMFYQTMFIFDRHRFLAFAGAYGTGKTVTSALKLLLTYMQVPNSESYVMSGTLDQLKSTFMKEFRKFLPSYLYYNKKFPTGGDKNNELYLVSGHTVKFIASNNENNIRSLTAVTIHMEEANGIDESVFDQVTARMRANSEMSGDTQDEELVYLRGKFTQVSITTNPDNSWTFDELIGRAIHPVDLAGVPMPRSHKPTSEIFGAFIIPTASNRHLPKDFLESMRERYSEVEFKAMVQADFRYKMGRIIDNVDSLIMDDVGGHVDLSRLECMCGLDFGQGDKGDDQAMIKAYIDFEKLKIFFVQEVVHKENVTIEQKVQDYLSDIVRDEPGLIGIFYDAIHGNKFYAHGENRKTIANMYYEAGLHKLYPTNNGKHEYRVIDRVEILKSWIAAGAVIIDSSCENLIADLKGWSYDPNVAGKPLDRKNHTIDAMIFIIIMIGKYSNFKDFDVNKFRLPLLRFDDKYAKIDNKGIIPGYNKFFKRNV